ncbi:MAG: RNA 2',3'-cyclic phosphodiesterase [Gammaproteobacteria bacterium]
MTTPDVRRLFLALWPSAAVRSALLEVQRHFAVGTSRAVNADNLHITLVFLGSTPSERRDCIEAALDGLEMPGFDLQLDRLGYWRRPQVVWAGSEVVPPPLTSLVEAMTEAAVQCGCKLDARPFHPHLTLFRKVRKPPRDLPALAPILWPAEAFALVESVTASSGVHYQILKTWPLAGGVSG